MTAAGAYRLGLYCLFSGHPLASFAREGALRVLIPADDPLWEQAFRAVFWAGQSDDAALRITVAGEQAGDCRRKLFSDEYPALPELLEKGYAALSFMPVPAEPDYDVVFSAEHMPLLREGGLLAAPDRGEEEALPELMRMARNIDFSCAMAYDQRRSEAAQHADFDAAFAREFGAEDEASYNADSSLAAAAFFSSHLEICGGDPAALSDAIRAQDERFCRMMALEHRRWVAYMAMRGYRAHRRENGEWELIYDGTHNHKHTGKKLHMCMCESGKTGLNPAMRTAEFWGETPPPADTPELDRASWECHRIACRKADAIRLDDLRCRKEFAFLNDPAFDALVRAVGALLRDEPNALAVYSAALRDARSAASAAAETPALDALDRELQIAKVRAMRVNFFGFDKQMVDMIPFCLWHGRRWGTVLTFTDGVAVEDVVIPTLLCAEEAVFAGEAAQDAAYQAAVTRYFAGRGDNTRARFVPCAPDTKSMGKLLRETVDGLAGGEAGLVLNQVRCSAPETAVALGMALARFPALAAVRYDPAEGIVAFDEEGEQLSSGLCSKSFSVEEYIALMGAQARPDGTRPLSGAESAALSALFWRHMYDRQDAKPLRQFSEFLRRDRAAESFPVKAPQPPQAASLAIPRGIFASCALGALLQSLQTCRIIRGLSLRTRGDEVHARFECVDPLLIDWLRPFEGPETPDRRLEFTPGSAEGVLRRVAVGVNKRLQPAERENVLAVAETLAEAGLISAPETDGETLAFRFYNPDVAALLADPGRLFEREVFAAIRGSGEFDDVQTGVHLNWDAAACRPAPDAPDDFGYAAYDARRQSAPKTTGTENELDVIAVRGMTALFCSCKTNQELSRNFIYEIDAVSRHFRALGALCVPRPLENVPGQVRQRASAQAVSLLSGDALCAPEGGRTGVFRRLAAGETVIE